MKTLDIQNNKYSMLKSRMYTLIKSKYETVRKFADEAKLEYTNVHKWTSTKIETQPNLDIIIAIAKLFPAANLRNLLIGQGGYQSNELGNETHVIAPPSEFLSTTYANQQKLIELLSAENESLKAEIKKLKSKKV